MEENHLKKSLKNLNDRGYTRYLENPYESPPILRDIFLMYGIFEKEDGELRRSSLGEYILKRTKRLTKGKKGRKMAIINQH